VTNLRRAGTVALAAVAAATLLATQGCDSVTSDQAPTAGRPDMTFTQARTVYQAYITASDTAAEQGDANTGLSVVADASWAFAHAQYTELASSDTPVQRYVYGTPTYYVPIVSGYPHWFMVDVPRRAAGSSPQSSVSVLMVFGQSASAGQWTLDGDAALEAGQSMPAIATNAQGYAISLSPYQGGLLLQPNLLGPTQAAIVNEGPANPSASLITPGPQTTSLYSQQNAIYTGTAKDLEYNWYMGGTSFPVFALQTTGGGALVLYGMYMNTEVEYPDQGEGSPIPIPADVKPLLGAPTEVGYHSVEANWTYEYATVDPPASASSGKATVIAATGAITYTHAY
jgi:hypothetical protein